MNRTQKQHTNYTLMNRHWSKFIFDMIQNNLRYDGIYT